MEKRILSATIVFLICLFVLNKYIFPPQQNTQNSVGVAPVVNMNINQPVQPSTVRNEQEGTGFVTKPQPIINQIDATIATNKLEVTFSNIGGNVKSLLLKDYHNMPLVKELPDDHAIFAIINDNIGIDLNTVAYFPKRTANGISYSYKDPARGIVIRKEYTLADNNDFITMDLYIDNTSSGTFDIGYTILGPSQIQAVESSDKRPFIELDSMIDGKVVKRTNIKGTEEMIRGIIAWGALKNRYFSLAAKPPADTEGISIRKSPDNQLSLGFNMRRKTLMPGLSSKDTFTLYAGPTEINRLKGANIGLENLEYYGFFGFIRKGLTDTLRFLHKVSNNWGIAIILLTFLVNLLFFPLTKISFLSIQRMQDVQPHIEKLKELHKDNPQRLNKEIMDAYKQYNVNPFGGCLPMLIQMPIFIAFYNTLLQSVDLMNAKFLWIKDLSSPDAIIKLSSPVFLIGENINILPIITAAIMFVQQKMSMASNTKASPEMQQQQKIMAIFFPLFFAVFLYNFPAGFAIYWLTNSLLMALEQYWLKKAFSTKKA